MNHRCLLDTHVVSELMLPLSAPSKAERSAAIG